MAVLGRTSENSEQMARRLIRRHRIGFPAPDLLALPLPVRYNRAAPAAQDVPEIKMPRIGERAKKYAALCRQTEGKPRPERPG